MYEFALLLSILMILAHSEGAAFLSKWLLAPVNRRQNLGSLWQCPALPPDMTYCSHSPAFFPESIQEANVWVALMSSRCHPQAMKFVCTIYNPACLHSHQVMPISPCREFCNEVYEACVSRMYLFGFKWPQQVHCSRFPSEETSMCVSGKKAAVTCTPCTQATSKENIIKKYCQADFVVKSQISRVTPFGNTSSLLVKVDRISEQLLPQPSIPLTSYLMPDRFLPPSTGFVDTNDERFIFLNHASRLRHQLGEDNQVVDMMAHDQADQSPTYLAANPASKSLMSSAVRTSSTDGVAEHSMSERGSRRLERKRLRRRSRRDKRSSFSSSFTRPMPAAEAAMDQSAMLLECAGCSLQLPTSPMVPNSAARWLIMAKKLNKSRLNLSNEPPWMQIISLMVWDKESTGFRDALRGIRTIPRPILCNPNAKVELNLDGFYHAETTTPLPLPQRWSRLGWPDARVQPSPPWNLPASFDGLFQNDAAAGNRKMKKPRRELQSPKFDQDKKSNLFKSNKKSMDKVENKRRRRRRKARKERLAQMTPQQRQAWLVSRRTHRAQSPNAKLRRMSKYPPYNQTT